jgi:hypothetical protein
MDTSAVPVPATDTFEEQFSLDAIIAIVDL